ncbi:MAG: GNAT family N-acetyltransferase [Oscillospiraceae bacterium]|jgi:ribosomal protein S18 acetylase RimI-like enzyme|nr:GNAT family N-acetyltransferase [Oscillospiraceae bacterium]
MKIRPAEEKDIPRLGDLLVQVCRVHWEGRPDLFRDGGRKYSDGELRILLRDPDRPVLVALDETGQVQGYAFCVLQRHQGEGSFQDMTTLYLDDLCVDEACRGRHAGRQLYDAVLALAREKGCYNVTLNVWACNAGAMRFYEGCGLQTQKIGLEVVL